MSFIHDTIKLHLVRFGYLADIPYHLLSDIEMCDAFITAKLSGDVWEVSPNCYFAENYPCIDTSLSKDYNRLVSVIMYHINCLKSSTSDSYKLPDWLYAYMLGEVVSINSSKLDIHDMLVAMKLDNLEDEFSIEAAKECSRISKIWLKKLPQSEREITDTDSPDLGRCIRSATMFGEPHVLKYLRLQQI